MLLPMCEPGIEGMQPVYLLARPLFLGAVPVVAFNDARPRKFWRLVSDDDVVNARSMGELQETFTKRINGGAQ